MTTDTRAAALPAWQGPIWRRVAPFLDLLDARYLPLLAVVSPQAWTVYAWLLADGSPEWVAALGGLGYEMVYIGAVAWAERGAGWRAARMPAVTALLFSVAVAVAYYGPRVGALAVLHAGFPLVAYAYTRMMHQPEHDDTPGLWARILAWVDASAALTVAPRRAPSVAQPEAPRATVAASARQRQPVTEPVRATPDDARATVARLVAQGMSASEAARHAGVKTRTAQRWMEKGGV